MKVLDLNTILRDLDKMLRRVIGEDIELVTLLTDDLEEQGRCRANRAGDHESPVNARDAMPPEGNSLLRRPMWSWTNPMHVVMLT